MLTIYHGYPISNFFLPFYYKINCYAENGKPVDTIGLVNSFQHYYFSRVS